MLLGKGALKICSKFTRESPWRRAISIKLQSNFNVITLRHVCSLVIYCIFSEDLLLKTPLEGCFCKGEVILFIVTSQAFSLELSYEVNFYKGIFKDNSHFWEPLMSFLRFNKSYFSEHFSVPFFWSAVAC